MPTGTSRVCFFPFPFPDFPQADPPPNSLPRNPLARACHVLCRPRIHRRSATSRPFGVSKGSLSPYETALAPDGPGGAAAPPLPRSAWPTRIRGSSVKGSDRPKRPSGRPQVGRARLIRVRPFASNCSAAQMPGTALLSPCAMLPAPHPPVKQRDKRLSPEPKSPWR